MNRISKMKGLFELPSLIKKLCAILSLRILGCMKYSQTHEVTIFRVIDSDTFGFRTETG